MYDDAMEKDIDIQAVMRLIMTSAFDCALTFNRNVVESGANNTRECNYTLCEYRCTGMTRYPYVREPSEITSGTFDIYFRTNESFVLNELSKMFKENFVMSLADIMNRISSTPQHNVSIHNLQFMLSSIVHKNFTFENAYGFQSYVREYNNVYYLTWGCVADYGDYFYTEVVPLFPDKLTFEELLKRKIDTDTDIIDLLSIDEATITTLPIEVQLRYVKYAVEQSMHPTVLGDEYDSINMILDVYEPYIKRRDGGNTVYLTLMKTHGQPVIKFDGEIWTDVLETGADDIKTEKDYDDKEDNTRWETFDYYGVVQGGKFKIVNVMATKKSLHKATGRECHTLNKPDLLLIISKLGIKHDGELLSDVDEDDKEEVRKIQSLYSGSLRVLIEHIGGDGGVASKLRRFSPWLNKSKGSLCKAIRKWFEDNNRIKYM
jgi:hypothetical protein